MGACETISYTSVMRRGKKESKTNSRDMNSGSGGNVLRNKTRNRESKVAELSIFRTEYLNNESI